MTIGNPKLVTKGTLYLKEHNSATLTASSQNRRRLTKLNPEGDTPDKNFQEELVENDQDELLRATEAVTLMKQRTLDAYKNASPGNLISPITPGGPTRRRFVNPPKRL